MTTGDRVVIIRESQTLTGRLEQAFGESLSIGST